MSCSSSNRIHTTHTNPLISLLKVTGTCLWYVTNLPLWLLQKPVLRVPTSTSDRMGQWFPMNNIRVMLGNWIITSSSALATCAHPHVCLVSFPDPPQKAERGSGVLRDISWGGAVLCKECHNCIFKSGSQVSDTSVHMDYYKADLQSSRWLQSLFGTVENRLWDKVSLFCQGLLMNTSLTSGQTMYSCPYTC